MNEVENFKNNINAIMNSNPINPEFKKLIIEELYKSVQTIINADLNDEQKEDKIFEIKKFLDVDLMRLNEWVYPTITSTALGVSSSDKNRGCDLRELFFQREIYNKDLDITNMLIDDSVKEKREELLNIFTQIAKKRVKHILTDIDDTIFAHPDNKGLYFLSGILPILKDIAGSDYSWIKKEPYPGIKTFYKQFYRKIADKNKRYSTILSATPGILKARKLNDIHLKPISYLQDKNDFAFIQGIDGFRNTASLAIPSIVDNDISKASKNIRSDNKEGIYRLFGKIKYIRAKQYKALFPEYDLIFIGDNGQGDEYAGEDMIKNKIVSNVFIHQIIDKENQEISCRDFKCRTCTCFKTYADLSQKLKDLNIFEESDVTEVTKNAKKEICESEKHTSKHYQCTQMGGKRTRKSRKKKSQKTKKSRKNKRRKTKRKLK
tara:strand:- start:31675 stop:32976 length:1302 start_codon:yes stop_codon:yes gene_type:complete